MPSYLFKLIISTISSNSLHISIEPEISFWIFQIRIVAVKKNECAVTCNIIRQGKDIFCKVLCIFLECSFENQRHYHNSYR